MFKQDYVMRLVKEMVRTILKILFHIDTDSPIDELLKTSEEKETLNELLDLVDKGNINEAENWLYDLISEGNQSGLEFALLFYSYLNDKPDEFLEQNNYSREEIKLGLKDISSRYGLDTITEKFLYDENIK